MNLSDEYNSWTITKIKILKQYKTKYICMTPRKYFIVRIRYRKSALLKVSSGTAV